jgi:hypothetical protein
MGGAWMDETNKRNGIDQVKINSVLCIFPSFSAGPTGRKVSYNLLKAM